METLKDLMKRGLVRMEAGDYIGLASDGIEVIIGHESDMQAIYDYLESYPTPDTW